MWPLVFALMIVGVILAWTLSGAETHRDTIVAQNSLTIATSLVRYHNRAQQYQSLHPDGSGQILLDNVADLSPLLPWVVVITADPAAIVTYAVPPDSALDLAQALQRVSQGDICAGIVRNHAINGIPLPNDAAIPDGAVAYVTFLEADPES